MPTQAWLGDCCVGTLAEERSIGSLCSRFRGRSLGTTASTCTLVARESSSSDSKRSKRQSPCGYPPNIPGRDREHHRSQTQDHSRVYSSHHGHAARVRVVSADTAILDSQTLSTSDYMRLRRPGIWSVDRLQHLALLLWDHLRSTRPRESGSG